MLRGSLGFSFVTFGTEHAYAQLCVDAHTSQLGILFDQLVFENDSHLLNCTVMNLDVGGGSLVWEQCYRMAQGASKLR